MIRLSKPQILLLHEQLIAETGGSSGLRDEGMLDSALNTPFQTFAGKDVYPSLQQKAARRCFGLVKNHPFVDGNKRIGAHVMLIDIDESMAEAAAEAIDPSGDAAKAYRCDISDEDSVRRVFCDIREKSISVDILVNNAAIWRTGNAEFIYSDSYNWKRKIGVNILGTLYCTHAALRGMTDRGWGG